MKTEFVWDHQLESSPSKELKHASSELLNLLSRQIRTEKRLIKHQRLSLIVSIDLCNQCVIFTQPQTRKINSKSIAMNTTLWVCETLLAKDCLHMSKAQVFR